MPNKMNRRKLIASVATMATGAILSRGATQVTKAFGANSPLLVHLPDDMDNLDPARIVTRANYIVANAIYSSLVKYDPLKFGVVIPDLAERWRVSNDGRAYTFWLRAAKWQRGYGDVTSRDVKFSFERQNDPKVASTNRAQTQIIDSVEAINDRQLIVHLKEPNPGFLVEVAAFRPGFIVNARALNDLGSRYLSNPVGSGAYMLERWEPGARITLRANPEYYGTKPKIPEVVLTVMKRDDLLAIALEKGEMDIGYIISPDIQSEVVRSHALRTIVRTGAQTMYVGINAKRPPWNDVRMRKALWHATNKTAIIAGVFHGLAHVSDTLLNPYVFGYTNKVAYPYDPAKAKQLMAQAGYGQGVEVPFVYYGPENWPNVAQGLQASWQSVGINVKLQQFEVAQLYQRYHDANFVLGGNSIQRVGPDQIVGYLLNSASIPFPNMFQYENPQMDELLRASKTELDEKKRADLYLRVQQKFWDDAPGIPLWQPNYVLAMRQDVKGAAVSPVQDYNLADITK